MKKTFAERIRAGKDIEALARDLGEILGPNADLFRAPASIRIRKGITLPPCHSGVFLVNEELAKCGYNLSLEAEENYLGRINYFYVVRRTKN